MSAAVTTAGVVGRMAICPQGHGPFPQVLMEGIPNVQAGFWVGTCEGCDKLRALDQQANEILRTRTSEIEARARAAIEKRQAEIEKRTAKDLEKDVAAFKKVQRPLWQAYHANLVWNEIVWQIEEELKANEIIPALKKAAER